MAVSAAFGTWKSPISAQSLAASGHPVAGAYYTDQGVWWLEQRPTERGRYAVRTAEGEKQKDILPAPWNARSRVHEYGGGAWTVAPEGILYFVEFSDQRIYRLDVTAGQSEPQPLTPAAQGFRFGELSLNGDSVIAVREMVAPSGEEEGPVSRDIVAVPIDGSGANESEAITSIVSGSDFVGYPRFSPDGSRFAWIAWNHPQMPWDGTELRLGTLSAEGTVSQWQTLAGSTTESVLQPEWRGDDELLFISDRSGWWNLYSVQLDDNNRAVTQARSLNPAEAETGGPLWNLGVSWYRPLSGGEIIAVSTLGSESIIRISPSGVVRVIDQPLSSRINFLDQRGQRLLLLGSGKTVPGGVRELDLGTELLHDIRLDVDDLPDEAVLPVSEAMSFEGNGRTVHAFVYPPKNPNYTGLAGERPPYLAFVHGGPTANVSGALDLKFAYFTSRGIGVIDINYGGSTGYGRPYRKQLNGQWGVVDVEDTITAVSGLAEAGIADPERLLIRGGSAGGWTVLSALTSSDVFAAGASYYGVADLLGLAETTHDFESRYLDGLVAPITEKELYEQRAPINNVDGLSVPVLLLQGLDDRVVPPEQSETFRDAMVAKGITHAYLAYEGESHGFRQSATIVHAYESELSFYGQVLGFEPAEVPVLPLWRG